MYRPLQGVSLLACRCLPPSTTPLPLPSATDSVTTPIVQTSTYCFKDTAELIAFKEGRGTSCEYGRLGNPTTRACEAQPSLGASRAAQPPARSGPNAHYVKVDAMILS